MPFVNEKATKMFEVSQHFEMYWDLRDAILRGASDLASDCIFNIVDTLLPTPKGETDYQEPSEFIHDLILNLENHIG